MKQLDLLNAIGSLDESILAESESMVNRTPRRILWRAAAVAAMVALLAVTVYAATTILSSQPVDGEITTYNISGVYTDTDGIFSEDDFVSGNFEKWVDKHSVEVRLQLFVGESLPNKLETYYFPQVPENWSIHGSFAGQSGTPEAVSQLEDNDLTEFYCAWVPDGYREDEFVQYMQKIISYDPGYYRNPLQRANEEPEYVLADSVSPVCGDIEISGAAVQVGGLDVYELIIGPSEPDNSSFSMPTILSGGERRLYWTDGFYIFMLSCPARMTDAEIEALLESFTTVDDIIPLLTSPDAS